MTLKQFVMWNQKNSFIGSAPELLFLLKIILLRDPFNWNWEVLCFSAGLKACESDVQLNEIGFGFLFSFLCKWPLGTIPLEAHTCFSEIHHWAFPENPSELKVCFCSQKESQSHRITECSGLEGTSVSHPVQPSCRSRVTYSRQHRTLSRWILNISGEGDSTTSLGSLCQGSVTLRGKKFFLKKMNVFWKQIVPRSSYRLHEVFFPIICF